jgi:hypothetical protein
MKRREAGCDVCVCVCVYEDLGDRRINPRKIENSIRRGEKAILHWNPMSKQSASFRLSGRTTKREILIAET